MRDATTYTGVAPRPLSEVTTPMAQVLAWDEASNLVAVQDLRDATEWPDGHRPQSVALFHDALYRVVGVEALYHQDSSDGSDDARDWRSDQAASAAADPMRPAPAAMVSALPDERYEEMSWRYDWLGNMQSWEDDAESFYERSLGRLENGADRASPERPSALHFATNIRASNSGVDTEVDRGGYVELTYGDSGNLSAMTVHGQCHDRDGTTACYDDDALEGSARADHLRARCACAVEQHYEYRWDEVNRLVDARRYDRAGGSSGSWSLAVRQRYRYDGGNQRTVKQTLEPGATEPERIALFVYPGDYERRGLTLDPIAEEYEASTSLGTESQYLVGGARVVYQHRDAITGLDPSRRVTVPLTDLIHTTTAVLDLESGELLEASTYYPNGARESYRGQDVAPLAAEPMGFTGKEADEEVGLVYFGERYLVARLGRWATPDPLHIHAVGGGEALNSYHYVAGNLLQARDALGLDPDDPSAGGRVVHVNSRPANVPESAPEWAVRTRTVPQGGTAHTLGFAPVEMTVDEVRDVALNEGLTRYVFDENASLDFETGQLLSGLATSLDAMDRAVPEVDEGMIRAAGMMRVTGQFSEEAAHFAGAGATGGVVGVAGYAAGFVVERTALAAGASEGQASGLRLGTELVGPQVASRAIPSMVRAARGLASRLGNPSICRGGVCPCFIAGTLIATANGDRPIEDLRAGDRVLSDDQQCGEVSVDGWLRMRLLIATDQDRFVIELLRPAAWLDGADWYHGALYVDLEELNVRGWARVFEAHVFREPPGAVPTGCPVTGTVHHWSQELLELRIGSDDNMLHLTPWHRLFSATRGDWVPAEELELGEYLATEWGAVVVDDVRRIRGPPVQVFNLEVLPTHEYYVGRLRVRAHNTYTGSGGGPGRSLTPAVEGTPYHPAEVEARRAAAQLHYLGTAAERAASRAGELLHEARRSGIGAGAGRSGGHGTPFLRASAQLQREAAALPRNDPMREALRAQARRLRARGNSINHPGGER